MTRYKISFENFQWSYFVQFLKLILVRIYKPVNAENALVTWFLVKEKKLNIYLGMQSNWGWLKILYFKIYIKYYFYLKDSFKLIDFNIQFC